MKVDKRKTELVDKELVQKQKYVIEELSTIRDTLKTVSRELTQKIRKQDKTLDVIAKSYIIEYYELYSKLTRVVLRLNSLGYDVKDGAITRNDAQHSPEYSNGVRE